MDSSDDHVTGPRGDSPIDDIIQEDTSAVNDGQDDEHGPVVKWRQNKKRKKKNQSLREMVFERHTCARTHTHTHAHVHAHILTHTHAYTLNLEILKLPV